MATVTETINEYELDILCVTEMWLFESDMNIIQAALPETHAILHVPRSATGSPGGGVAVIYSLSLSSITLVNSDLTVIFEFMEVVTNFHHQITKLVIVYCPGHPGTDRNFMEVFSGDFLWEKMEDL